MILETERLYLREMTHRDYPALCKILQDEKVMYAYNGAFADKETYEWLENQLLRYKQLGIGLWAVILRSTNEMIGQCGLTLQTWEGSRLLEVGYLFQHAYWHKGYATEAAKEPSKATINFPFIMFSRCSLINTSLQSYEHRSDRP